MYNANIQLLTEGWAQRMRVDCDNAKKSIYICAMSMVPPRTNTDSAWLQLFESWARAVSRGTAVHLWIAAPQCIPAATKANVGSAAACVRRGIFVHFVVGPRLLHSKSCIIDKQAIWIGSGNLTAAATTTNHEAFIRADCAPLAEKMASYLEGLV